MKTIEKGRTRKSGRERDEKTAFVKGQTIGVV